MTNTGQEDLCKFTFIPSRLRIKSKKYPISPFVRHVYVTARDVELRVLVGVLSGIYRQVDATYMSCNHGIIRLTQCNEKSYILFQFYLSLRPSSKLQYATVQFVRNFVSKIGPCLFFFVILISAFFIILPVWQVFILSP